MNDQAAVTQVLNDYYSAFSTLDVQAIVPYYHEPSLFITPLGVNVAHTCADMVATLTTVTEGLRVREYGRSELSMLHVKHLSDTATLASGVALRYRADGQELERVGVTYLLHKADSRWKIAVTVIHDTNTGAHPE
jgi:ketosteroid isomerase-like protein